MKPFVEAPQPVQAPATSPGQHYAELHLEDIVGLTVEPGTGDAAAPSRSAPMSDGATHLNPPQDPRKGTMLASAGTSMSAHLTAGAVQQGPPQEPRTASTDDASALPPLLGSTQQGLPQDPRKLQAPDLAAPAASAAPAGSQPVESSTQGMAAGRPKDPRLAAGGLHSQQHLRNERQPPNLAGQQMVQAGEGSLPGLDNAHPSSSAETPPAGKLSTQLSDLDGDEALLYRSEPDLIPSMTQAQHAGGPSRNGQHLEAQKQATVGLAEEQLYGDPFLLAEGDQCAAKSARAVRLDSDEEVAIPGLDSSHSAEHLNVGNSLDALQSGNASQLPSVDRQQAALSTGLSYRQTGALAAHADQRQVPHSASALRSHLPVDAADVRAFGVDRSSVEQGTQRPTAPRPVTIPAPGRPGRTQAPFGAVPKPVILKPPAAARQGAGGFKPHTTDYKR